MGAGKGKNRRAQSITRPSGVLSADRAVGPAADAKILAMRQEAEAMATQSGHRVARVERAADGTAIWWDENESQHRAGGPAVTASEDDLAQGAAKLAGSVSRQDGPAADAKILATRQEAEAMAAQSGHRVARVERAADGTVIWWDENESQHRAGGPAVTASEDDLAQGAAKLAGSVSRQDGPAADVEGPEWWADGKSVRVRPPTEEYPNGSREEWVDGKLHSVSPLPAIGGGDGEWWKDGVRHLLPSQHFDFVDKEPGVVNGKSRLERKLEFLAQHGGADVVDGKVVSERLPEPAPSVPSWWSPRPR